MRVFVIWNVYEEAHNLPRSVAATDLVMGQAGDVHHVFVDGRYPDFPSGSSDVSTDGTRAFAEAHGVLLTVVDYECEKRTAGLRHIDTRAEEGDWVLVLDADEELTGIFGTPDRVGSFNFTRTSDGVPYGRCRLFAWEPGLHFKDRHYTLYASDGSLVSSLEDAPDWDEIGTGIHHDRSHDPERFKTKRNYYRVLREREGHPTEVHA